jgi:drug/metabolite transporter (DMT)-like permease
MKVSHLVLLLLMNMCWSGVYSAYKVIERDLPEVGAAPAIVTLRFGLAGLCLAAVWPWLKGATPKGRDFGIACLMGVLLFTIGQRLQVYGNQIGSAGNSSVLMAVEPLVTSVAGAIFFREHIGPRRVAGFALGLFGVALLNRVWQPGFQLVGLAPSLIFLSSFICESAYSVLGKPVIERVSVMKVLAISLLAGLACNLLIDGPSTVAAAKNLTLVSWALLWVLAIVCTAIGYALWFIVIREAPLNVAALTIFAQSVFGVMFAAFWIGEKLHWGHLFGSIVIVCGLVLGLSRQITHAKPQEVKR